MTDVYLPDLIGKGYGDFWNTRCRYRVCKGSRGSKKSKTTALNRIFRILKYPESNYLCVRRYTNTIRDSIYADTLWAISQFGLDAYFKPTLSPLEITYLPTGQKILFRGLDDGIKVTSISVTKGVLNFVDIEEAYEISEGDFNKLDMSIRGQLPEGYFKQITLIFNPWSAQSWLKARFFDYKDDTIFAKTTTYRCNEWLDDADRHIFELMQKQNPRRYRIEGEGEWGIAEGLIYENVEQQEFDVAVIRRTEGIKAAFNLDFGFTDPNAFVCELVDNKNKIIYIFDEWYAQGVTNQIIAKQIKAMGYGCERWEKMLKIVIKPTDTLELRRFTILSKLLEDLPYTMRRLHEVLARLCGAKYYSVILKHNEYFIQIWIEIQSMEKRDIVIETVKRMIPANLVLDVQINYRTHGWLNENRLTHGAMHAYTHAGIRIIIL